uniref:Uncharacterized protein n=1 Tax=Arundo donax TaxID=35708 RepID=A0A0A9B539_ARUDO
MWFNYHGQIPYVPCVCR